MSTRQKFIHNIASNRLITRHIVLISPDHFSQNQQQLTTSSRTWNLSTGNAVYNNFLNLDLPTNDLLLQNDHGIYNPLTDLKNLFPFADFYPILIGQKTQPPELNIILDHLLKYCKLDCLLVASVDFSHYLPATLANVHDAFTMNNLQNLDTDNLLKSEVDSPQSLYLLSSFAKARGANRWNLFAHTNSGFISHNPDIETTTHVLGYYSVGSQNLSNIATSINVPYPIQRSQNQTTFGDRFFYGVDSFSTLPTQASFVVSKIISSTEIAEYYLPIKNNNFVRGEDKRYLIKELFDTISDQNISKDYFWGKLTYERHKKTPSN
jgi:AmmeMemoRadiSam system protein B